MEDLTDQQRADAAYVESLYEPGKRLRLDFSDERQYRYAVCAHSLVGQTADIYPGLHRGLAEAREAHIAAGGPPALDDADDAGFETKGYISSVSRQTGTLLVSAQAVSTVLHGSPVLHNALYVKDADQNILARGQSSQWGNGTGLNVQTASQGARTVSGPAKAVLAYTYQPGPGGGLVTEVVQRGMLADTSKDPRVIEPKQVRTKGKRIRIAIDRGPEPLEHEDVDYWFGKGTDSLMYLVPLVGSAEFEGTVQSVEVSGALVRGTTVPEPEPAKDGGLMELSQAEADRIAAACTTGGMTIEWNFPESNPVTFGKQTWNTADSVFMTIIFTVNLVGQLQPVAVSVVCAEAPDTNPEDGTAFIKPLEFVFHCLAEGTRISLADGSTEAIEALTKENVLEGVDGVDPRVVSTVLGEHRGSVLRLTVDAERELVLSHDHLVLTPSGPRPARELAAGDEVTVDDGVAPLAAVAEEEFEGLLCNASLSLPEEPADPSRNAMIANGICVGDYELRMQGGRAQAEDPEWILAHLDEMYHEDYRNYIAAKAATAR